MPALHSYDDVVVSHVAFDAARLGWKAVPRALLADWLAVVSRVAAAIAPGFAPPPLPSVLSFHRQTIASDGPYGADENYYLLDHFSLRLAGVLISYEYGRRFQGPEPLLIETTDLPHNLMSSMTPGAAGAGTARFLVWHEPAEADVVRRALAG